jgi:predicted NUDIX family phosphoesterase
VKRELILAVKESDIKLPANGFTLITEENTIELDETNTWFGPRCILENDTSFRQIIPYAIIKKDDSILMYERQVTGGEARLHGLKSIGFGGHVNLRDDFPTDDGMFDAEYVIPENFVYSAYARELYEELGANIFEYVSNVNSVGYIHYANDSDVDDVNKVHMGIVFIVDLSSESDEETISADELEIGKCTWVPISELESHIPDMEMWSKEASKYLIGQ